MNESDFENELAALEPAMPSAAWSERVARAMAAEARGNTVRHSGAIALSRRVPATLRRLGWALAGAAASALLIVTWRPEVDLPAANTAALSPAPEVPRPIETARALLDAEEEGVFDDDSQEPERRIRFIFLERHTWKDPRSGTLIAVEVSREDVFLVPVAMQ